MDPNKTRLEDSGAPEPPDGTQDRIRGYRLIQQVGEGGMGEVWQSEQLEPVRRMVALKLIKIGLDTKEVVARFESERQALALMDHPNIARVFGAGATERGRPFFAMEFVEGVPITDYCDRHLLPTRQRLELFMQVCEGVQHAHQKGIIHRDIKPSNVLVRIQDDRPVPKIIDFGVAKATVQTLTDKPMHTQLGTVIGTPEYMSPEQAEMTGLNVDTRTDVYSLGVLLYELLVGTLPFDSEELRQSAFDEVVRKIREDDPRKPSTRFTTLDGDATGEIARKHGSDPTALARGFRGDLDWITMKALEKDRTRRYGSPAELAADIERHLSDRPVLAGPPSVVYRMRKFVRRHKIATVAACLVALAVIGGLIGTSYGLVRATRAEAVARTEAASAEQVTRFLVDLFKVSDPGQARGNSITAREILDRGAEKIGAELTEQPLVHAEMMGTIGQVYLNLGLYEEARPLLEQALDQRRAAVGDDDLELVADMNGLGTLLFRLGDSDGARELFDEAMTIRKARLAADDPEIAASLNYLGAVAQRTGDREQARSLFEEALAIRDKALAPDDPLLAQSQGNLARVLSALGEHEQARDLLERSLAIQEKTLGPDHHKLGNSLDSLANVTLELGDYERARELFERALVLFRKTLGPDHARVGYAENNLARLLKKTGDYDGAREHYESALEINEKTLGPDHSATALVLYNLARVSALQSRRSEALELLNRSAGLGVADEIQARGYVPIGEEPDLASLRGDAEFEAILATAN